MNINQIIFCIIFSAATGCCRDEDGASSPSSANGKPSELRNMKGGDDAPIADLRMIVEYEQVVVDSWNEARDRILNKEKSFSVKLARGDVMFLKSEDAEPTVYMVSGLVDGVVTVTLNSERQVSEATFMPWYINLRADKTRIVLESPESRDDIFDD